MGANESVSRAAVRDAMRVTGLSQKAMAINADIPESVLSDALNGRGRNFELDWLMAQGREFVSAFEAYINTKLGITVESRRQLRAQRIAELVELLVEDCCA